MEVMTVGEQITAGEAAKRLGVSWGLLWKLEHLGVTPQARRLGRFRVYTNGEVETLREIITKRRATQQSQRRDPVAA